MILVDLFKLEMTRLILHENGLGKDLELRPSDHAQHPVGRVGQPEDAATAVAFLLSDGATFITGQNFAVDGGMTKKMIYAE